MRVLEGWAAPNPLSSSKCSMILQARVEGVYVRLKADIQGSDQDGAIVVRGDPNTHYCYCSNPNGSGCDYALCDEGAQCPQPEGGLGTCNWYPKPCPTGATELIGISLFLLLVRRGQVG